MSQIIKPWEVKSYQQTTRADNPKAGLSIIEFSKLFPDFEVAPRIYFIDNLDGVEQFRAGHYHPEKPEILWADRGETRFEFITFKKKGGLTREEFTLKEGDGLCLMLRPFVFHRLWLSPGARLYVACPAHFNPEEAQEDDKYLEHVWE